MQLIEGLLPGGFGHPGELCDLFCQHLHQGPDDSQDLLLAPGAEGGLHIELTHGIPEPRLGELHAAFPAGSRFLSPTKRPFVEIKVLVHERRGEIRRPRAHEVKAQITLPGIERGGLQEELEPAEKPGHAHVHAREGGRPDRSEVLIPGE